MHEVDINREPPTREFLEKHIDPDRFLGADHQGAEGLLGRYYELLVGFARVKEHLQKKNAYFSKPEKSELTLTLFRDGDERIEPTLHLGFVLSSF